MNALRFRLLGYPVQIGVGFCAALCLVCWIDRSGTMRACVLAAAVHELAHLTAMRALCWSACEIRLTALGIRLIRREQTPYPYRAECIVLLAGPAANLLMAAVLAGIGRQWSAVHPFMMAQLTLGLFNLLPVEPLDGGQTVNAMLRQMLPLKRADRVADLLTMAVLLPLASTMILQLLRQRMNFSLLAATVYLIIFFVMKER